LAFAPDSLSLSITDDGSGFDPAAPLAPDRHFGLLGMRERARLLPARLIVDSAPGRGTNVSLTLDLNEPITL
jgi:signal transduction histidine kinase